ncbi:MAG: hypothetical protein K2X60_08115 [Xanthobacteraceae bacterium]|nr:hypothetical protein [Xanthobacteraceae bacterium]
MKKIFAALTVVAALAVAGSMSATPVQAKPAMTKADNAQTADRAVTDVSARRYYRRYGYGRRVYRPYAYGYRPYAYGYRPYRPYGYGGGYYRRPGIYLGF